MYYVALAVGCIECNEPTEVAGIFTSLAAAEAALPETVRPLGPSTYWKGDELVPVPGQYGYKYWRIIEVAEIDVTNPPLPEGVTLT